jgi:putative ubiquitin-RnfH superfamily antitoxin RatB of RatAB toxin-antitoxin module
VQVIEAKCGQARVAEVLVPAATAARDVLIASGLPAQIADVSDGTLALASHGILVGPDTPIQAGDRIEILRPLREDPKAARRRIAAHRSAGK